MEKIQLLHPEKKKAISMDRVKYGLLKDSFLGCLKLKKHGSFKELSQDVEKDLRKRRNKIQGKLEWSLFWVTLDLEAGKEICRDKSKSPFVYSLP
jgi:hypothetical protein